MRNQATTITRGIVYIEFDGVLSTCQSYPNKAVLNEEDTLKFHIQQPDPYSNARAPRTMQNLVRALNPETTYILTAATSSFEFNNKKEFIRINYPTIHQNNILFVNSNDYKPLLLEVIYSRYYQGKYPRNQLTLIDSHLDIIEKVGAKGFTAYHVSSFIA